MSFHQMHRIVRRSVSMQPCRHRLFPLHQNPFGSHSLLSSSSSLSLSSSLWTGGGGGSRHGFRTASQTDQNNDPEKRSSQKQQQQPGFKAFADVEYDAMMDLFHHHAKDKGHLDRSDIRDLLTSVGERPTEQDVDALFAKGDLDGNGNISLEEFLTCADSILGDAPARIVLVVGGPGSGKGVLCQRLEKTCHVVHLSSGAMLRQEVQRGTLLGKQVQEIMARGELVSSAVIVALMRRRMRGHPGKRVLLDGFPRSIENAHDMIDLCGKPELALHLEADDTVLLERILKRKENRADDNFETALERLRTFHKSHHTTMDWLKEQGVPIVNLDCSGTRENVWEQLLAIGRLMRPACKSQIEVNDSDDIGLF